MSNADCFDPLTQEQFLAVQKIAAMHGRQWKAFVRDMWDGRQLVITNSETLVYALRNTHGPSWLNRFRVGKYRCGECGACQKWLLDPASAPRCELVRGEMVRR